MDNIKQAQNQISNSILKLYNIKATMIAITADCIVNHELNIKTEADYKNIKKILKFLNNKELDQLWAERRVKIYNRVYYTKVKNKKEEAGDK